MTPANTNGREAPVGITEPGSIASTQPAPRAGRGARPPSPPSSTSTSLSSSTHSGLEAFVAAPPSRGRPAGHRMTAPPSPAALHRQSRAAHHPHHIGPDRASAGRSPCTTTHIRQAGSAAPRFPARQPSRAPLPSSPRRRPPQERVHEQLVRRHLRDHIIGHILAHDATEIEAREKPCRRSPDDLPPPCAAQAQAQWAIRARMKCCLPSR